MTSRYSSKFLEQQDYFSYMIPDFRLKPPDFYTLLLTKLLSVPCAIMGCIIVISVHGSCTLHGQYFSVFEEQETHIAKKNNKITFRYLLPMVSVNFSRLFSSFFFGTICITINTNEKELCTQVPGSSSLINN